MRTTPATCTLAELAELSGMSQSVLRNWRYLGLLPPASVDAAVQGGRPSVYGPREIAVALVLAGATRQGVGRSHLAEAARHLRVELEDAGVATQGFDGLVVLDVAAGRSVLLPRSASTRVADAVIGAALVVELRVGGS